MTEQPKEPQPPVEKSQPGVRTPLIERLHRAFGPLVGGAMLDLVDLSSFGPFGIGGFFVGGLTGWWICSIYNIATSTRLILALLAGIYCLFPLTEFIPVATLLSAFIRFRGAGDSKTTE